MEKLQIISNIAITFFAVFYVIRIFWQPERITKKSILKKTLQKTKIDLWSMEFDQAIKQQFRGEVKEEAKDLEKQIKEMDELIVAKEEELKVLKEAKEQNWELCEAKNKEITEAKAEKDKLGKEMEEAQTAMKWLATQIAEITKQRTMKERSLAMGSGIIKILSSKEGLDEETDYQGKENNPSAK